MKKEKNLPHPNPLIRICHCPCSGIAELRKDKNLRPYMTCKLCGTKIFFQSMTSTGYFGFQVLDHIIESNPEAHHQAVASMYYKILKAEEAKRRAEQEQARQPRPRPRATS